MSTPDPLRVLLADIIRKEFPMLQRPAGPHTYRVDVVHSDGRVSLRPERSDRGLEDIPRVDHWCGIAGGASLPMVGSTVLVEFADGDPTRPVLVSYQPLRSAGGKPTRTTIDATTLQLGPTATVVELGGGAQFVALANLVATNMTTLKTAITNAAVLAGDGGATFKAALVAALTLWPASMAAAKVKAT